MSVDTSTCRHCGARIWWADKPSGGRFQPLELYSARKRLVIIDDNGFVQEMRDLYVPHLCPRDESQDD